MIKGRKYFSKNWYGKQTVRTTSTEVAEEIINDLVSKGYTCTNIYTIKELLDGRRVYFIHFDTHVKRFNLEN